MLYPKKVTCQHPYFSHHPYPTQTKSSGAQKAEGEERACLPAATANIPCAGEGSLAGQKRPSPHISTVLLFSTLVPPGPSPTRPLLTAREQQANSQAECFLTGSAALLCCTFPQNVYTASSYPANLTHASAAQAFPTPALRGLINEQNHKHT